MPLLLRVRGLYSAVIKASVISLLLSPYGLAQTLAELPGYVTRNIKAQDPSQLFYRLKIPFGCEVSGDQFRAVINETLLGNQIQPTIELEDYLSLEAGAVFLYFEISCIKIAVQNNPDFGFAFKIDGKFGKVFADENGVKSDFLLDQSYGLAGSDNDYTVIIEAVRSTANSMLHDFRLVNFPADGA